jgi:hypothetical protein
MKSKTEQRYRHRQLGLWVMLLGASVILIGLRGIGAQGRQFRVAVLTP